MSKVLNEHIESLAKQIVDIAFQIHRTMPFVIQKKVPIVYDNISFEEGLRLDLLVDDLVIVEIKAQENYHPVWEAQLLSYLKLAS